jgi:uncharacterized protein
VGKILVWVVILGLAYVVWRLMIISKRRVDRSRDGADADRHPGDGGSRAGGGPGEQGRDPAGRLRAPEAMMQCSVCGVHLPGSDAVFARGRVFCSAEHRDHEATQRAPNDGTGR